MTKMEGKQTNFRMSFSMCMNQVVQNHRLIAERSTVISLLGQMPKFPKRPKAQDEANAQSKAKGAKEAENRKKPQVRRKRSLQP
jgi:hypothetical protein